MFLDTFVMILFFSSLYFSAFLYFVRETIDILRYFSFFSFQPLEGATEMWSSVFHARLHVSALRHIVWFIIIIICIYFLMNMSWCFYINCVIVYCLIVFYLALLILLFLEMNFFLYFPYICLHIFLFVCECCVIMVLYFFCILQLLHFRKWVLFFDD